MTLGVTVISEKLLKAFLLYQEKKKKINNLPMDKCSLWPKQCSLVQLFTDAVLIILAVLSVVMHTSRSSCKLHAEIASLRPAAIHPAVWSCGKNKVCKSLLFISNSLSIKWTVKLRYGSAVVLDHKSVVAAKYSILQIFLSISSRHFAYSKGSAT